MSETNKPHWHSVPKEFDNRLDEFGAIILEEEYRHARLHAYVDKYLRHSSEGKPDMKGTADAMGVPVVLKPASEMHGVKGRIPYSRDGLVIQVDKSISIEEIDFTIGHEIGHVFIFHRRQMVTGNFWADAARLRGEAYAKREALCDYTSAKMLGYIALL